MSKKSNTARVLETVVVEPVVEQPVAPVMIKLDDKGRKTEVIMSRLDLETKGIKNTSQAIRYLIGEGYSPSAVAKFLGKRYQHVRNVMNQVLKRPATETVVASVAVPQVETTVDFRAVESAIDG